MKSVLVIHGTLGSPDINWFPWLQAQATGYKIIIPEMPTPEGQNAVNWLRTIEELAIDPDIVIGHSIGATFLLHYLQARPRPVEKSLFIAPVMGIVGHPEYDALNETFHNSVFDWDAIRRTMGEAVILYSDNDPYLPQWHAGTLGDRLSVAPNLIRGGGHLNGESGYTRFPLLLDLI